MQFDVVANRVPFEHLRAEWCDRGATGILCRPSGLVGPAQEVRSAVAPRYAGSDADTDGTGELLAVDHDLLVNSVLQPMSKRHSAFDVHRCKRHDDKLVTAEPRGDRGNVCRLAQELGEALDEPVAGVLTEVLVHDLEAVQIEEQDRNWARLTLSQSFVEVGDQRSAVQQAREVIMLGEVADLVFGDDAGLQLSE